MRGWGALVALLILLTAAPAHAGYWLPGSAVNPTTNQVIVTTAALAAQQAKFTVFLRSTVAVTVAVERLNGSGVAVPNDSTQFVLAAGASPLAIDLTVQFNAGDTFQVRVVSGVTGTVQAALRFNAGGYCLQGLGCAH